MKDGPGVSAQEERGESKGKDRDGSRSARKQKKRKHSKAGGQDGAKEEAVEAPLSSRVGRSKTERRVREALSHHAITMEQMCYSRAEVQQLQQQVDALHTQVNEVSELVCSVVGRHAAESATRFDQFDRLYGTAFYQMEQLLRSEMNALKLSVTAQLKSSLAGQQEELGQLVQSHLSAAKAEATKVTTQHSRAVEESTVSVPDSHAGAVELLEAKLQTVRQDVEAEVMETVNAHLDGASEKISQELLQLINERLEAAKQPVGGTGAAQPLLPSESDVSDYDSDAPPANAPPPPPEDSEASGAAAAATAEATRATGAPAPEAAAVEAAATALQGSCLSSTDDTAVS